MIDRLKAVPPAEGLGEGLCFGGCGAFGGKRNLGSSLRRHSRLSGPAERCYFPDLGFRVFLGNQIADCSRPRAGSGSSTAPPAKTGRWLNSDMEEPPDVESLTYPGVGCTLQEEPRVATTAQVELDNAQMPGVSSNGDRGPNFSSEFSTFSSQMTGDAKGTPRHFLDEQKALFLPTRTYPSSTRRSPITSSRRPGRKP